MDKLIRTKMLLGEEALEKLARSRVAVFGVGGVGGYVVEALARGGIGAIDVIDSDTVVGAGSVLGEAKETAKLLVLGSGMNVPAGTKLEGGNVIDANNLKDYIG